MEKEFVSLLNQHRGIIFKICKVYCQNEEDRQDLFQEIVLQLWKAFPAFKHEANVSTWMYRIGMNTAISNYRKEKTRQPPISFSNLPYPLPDFSETDDFIIETAPLYKAIDQLSPIEKALVLLYLDNNSYDEMAVILGISKSNVGVKLNRIKVKLEKLIKSFQN
ncbi:RNA polymerase sigma factor [Dyadobacter frigoris]|uniref:RNA polymerase sigma factor n=1 Tax=Dyadobacter frigoris TaxID=2576211 RepID=A0A4U6DE54_9BACT|nr:RNA polymerase sigma factor [Dyadobacter frigoris]TKT92764.1 RNA polymerase sigma factor [Dyadobacter frigoris]GLU51666.1 DNA-directed RNA polymerase sigma-70 factor [Dyadobacter frigoris]